MEPDRQMTAFRDLSEVMARLREDCPWDRGQTHRSLRRYLLEETYEVLHALDSGDDCALREEIGDLLFQVWFHAEVASEEEGGFDLADIVEGVAEKLRRRHPHVFGDATAESAAHVKANWERLKAEEKGRKSRLDGVPTELPGLLSAQCLQDKAAAVGFDWEDASGVLGKVREEFEEVVAELPAVADANGATAGMEEELGDLLFSMVNLARHMGVDAESAMRGANQKFTFRFRHIEDEAARRGLDLESMDLKEMEVLWEEAKGGPPSS